MLQITNQMEDKITIFTELFSETLIREFDETKTLPKIELTEICKTNLHNAKEYKYLQDSNIDYYKAIENISMEFKTLHDKHYTQPLDLDECYDKLFDQIMTRLLSM